MVRVGRAGLYYFETTEEQDAEEAMYTPKENKKWYSQFYTPEENKRYYSIFARADEWNKNNYMEQLRATDSAGPNSSSLHVDRYTSGQHLFNKRQARDRLDVLYWKCLIDRRVEKHYYHTFESYKVQHPVS